jgi:signal transduction histidine kinase
VSTSHNEFTPRNSAPKINPATALQRAQKDLAESEQRNRLALEAAGIGTWSWNVATGVVTWDARCKALFGFSETEPNTTYQAFFSRLLPEDQKSTADSIKECVETTGEYDIIHRVIWRDKSVHWLRCKGRYIKGAKAAQLAGVAVDATWLKMSEQERLQAEGQLRKANDDLERRVRERTAELERSTAQIMEQSKAAMHLSSRILKVQDEERRSIGRELHDSLGQSLTVVKLNLDLLSNLERQTQPDPDRTKYLSQCLEAVEDCLKETRTISHLLHPPLLDEVGFGSAARWYVDTFSRRGGREVKCNIPDGLPRLRKNTELALFRVMQESLTNVHRHSGCSRVEVTIDFDDENVTLRVKDNGIGIPGDRLKAFRNSGGEVGIGLAGMRERMRDLGGRLVLDSNGEGTTVTAVVPVVKEPSSFALASTNFAA